MKRSLISALAILALAATAQAKDLSGMWGAGFTRGLVSPETGHTSVAVRYWVDKQLAIEATTGFLISDHDTNARDTRSFSVGGRFLIKVVEEDNLHAYGGAGLSLLNEKTGSDSDSGVGVEAFAGVEYFFSGLPNLGFSSELGFIIEELGDRTTFGTAGGSFLDVGIRYYF